MTGESTHYVPSPLMRGPCFRLPGGKTVAVWIGVHLEYWNLLPPDRSFVMKGIHGNWPDHFPDYRTHSFYEYGNRVGIFRVLDVLARLGLPVTIILNADAIGRYGPVIEEARRLGADFILQGRMANRMITSAMSEPEEREEIETALQAYLDGFGRPAEGWMGPQAGESVRTLRILAAAGIKFVVDWPSDDHPHLFATDPPILSIPYQWELDDVDLLWTRNARVRHYPRIILSAYGELAKSRSASARVLGLHIHPWLLGQPARVRHLEEALVGIKDSPDADFMRASDVGGCALAQLAADGAPDPAPVPS